MKGVHCNVTESLPKLIDHGTIATSLERSQNEWHINHPRPCLPKVGENRSSRLWDYPARSWEKRNKEIKKKTEHNITRLARRTSGQNERSSLNSLHLTWHDLISSQLTAFHLNWVRCDWLQLRRTGSWATSFVVAVNNHNALGRNEMMSVEIRSDEVRWDEYIVNTPGSLRSLYHVRSSFNP